MASVGWIGLGKLGAPCAAALARYGEHTVIGYDVRGTRAADYAWGDLEPVKLVENVRDVVAATDDVVFVAVQTPHRRDYGGEQPIRGRLVEFEYQYLVNAVRAVCTAARQQRKHVTLVVVSTVLPGTFDRHLRALLNEYVTPVYHPFFIAMGTVVDDFVRPEMTLFGADRDADVASVLEVYATLPSVAAAPHPVMSISSAELTKVAYNTFITSKIVFANTLMELSEHTGADVDEVTEALALATDRVVSARYLRAGMGDGGACHPRDNVALAALAERYHTHGNYFYELIRLRERQSDFLVSVIDHWNSLTQLPVVVLGRAYKPDVALDDGSPALLLLHGLSEAGVDATSVDPVMRPRDESVLSGLLKAPHVWVLATLHNVFLTLKFPAGSIVIDPFGFVDHQDQVTLVTPGRRRP